MNAKRQLSGLKRVNWEKKSTKQKVKYLTNKLTMLGYKIPTYLKNGQLTDRQLKSQINKIEKGLNSQIKNKTSESKNKLSIDVRLNRYIKNYNKQVDKTIKGLEAIGLTKEQIDYLSGKDIFLPAMRNKSYKTDGVALKKIGDLIIEDDSKKLEMLNKLKRDYKKITLQKVYERINDDTEQNRWFADFMSLKFVLNMQGYERQSIWNEWNTLSPLQKELYIKGVLNSLRDKYLTVEGGEALDKASTNSYARIISTIQEYKNIKQFN